MEVATVQGTYWSVFGKGNLILGRGPRLGLSVRIPNNFLTAASDGIPVNTA